MANLFRASSSTMRILAPSTVRSARPRGSRAALLTSCPLLTGTGVTGSEVMGTGLGFAARRGVRSLERWSVGALQRAATWPDCGPSVG